MNEETFIVAMRILHEAYHGLDKPESEEQYICLRNLLEGYIAMLVDFDKEMFEYVQSYVISHPVLKEEEIVSIYSLFTDAIDDIH